MLEANGRMLQLTDTLEEQQSLRLGLGPGFERQFFESRIAEQFNNMSVVTDNSAALSKGLIDGLFDIACIYESSDTEADLVDLIVNESTEEFAWVKSKDFVLRPGAPIPILISPVTTLSSDC